MKSAMFIPAEFKKMADNFHQDSFDREDSLTYWAKFVLWNLSAAERNALKAYLSEIVTDRCSDEQLQAIWAQTSAEIGFDPGLRIVLAMVRDQID